MSGEINTKIRKRITVVQVALAMMIILLGIKAIEIQIFQASNLSMRAEKEYMGQITLRGKRGDILDRNQKKLSTSIDAVSVAASPKKIKKPGQTASMLADVLKLDRRKLKAKLSTKKSFVWIKKKISSAEAEKIKKLNIKGIFFKKDVIRFYPNRELAAQLIGITGADGNGLEGIEYQYNGALKGGTEKIKVTKDASGKYFNEDKNIVDRLKGDTLKLNLDRTIQFISERALKDAVISHKAKSGIVIVMRPGTGEVLAMAHYPQFNPNSFSDFSRYTWRNRGVTDPFEPGSTMKIFLVAAAMEKKLCTPASIFFCENGKYRVGRSTVHDTHSYDWLTLGQIIKYSSNIGVIKISEIMGSRILFESLSSFGFGEKTGIDCPGESTGTLRPYQRWSKIDTGAIAFGQGVSVSAIQLITGLSAIANGGILLKPRLVGQVISHDGSIKKNLEPEPVKRILSRQSADRIKKMMRTVVEDGGTGTNAAIEGYSVCGKTGTAQKVAENGKGYSRTQYTASFAGFAPWHKPELAVLVVVDEPKDSHYGSVVAAPAFKTIVSESFHYLNIPPEQEFKKLVAGKNNDGA